MSQPVSTYPCLPFVALITVSLAITKASHSAILLIRRKTPMSAEKRLFVLSKKENLIFKRNRILLGIILSTGTMTCLGLCFYSGTSCMHFVIRFGW